MRQLRAEASAFAARIEQDVKEARQRVALQLACGIDIDDARRAAPTERLRILERIARALRRERMKGQSRHWSYDLNRHIALKQALERLRTIEDS